MKKNLIIFITTYQSPHYEASFYYARKYRNNYREIKIINLVGYLDYRHEYTWRSHNSFKLNISRKIRNGANKKISYLIEKFKNKYTFIDKFFYTKTSIPNKDIHQIMETYSCTEHGISFLKHNKYSNILKITINKTAAITESIIHSDFINKEDDILLFNGRLPVEFTIQKKLFEFRINNLIFHECNNYQNKIYFMNHSLHKLGLYKQEIENFHHKNESKVLSYWYANKQISNINEKKYITYFTSSNDEYKFTYEKPIDQSRIINDLLKINFGNYEFKIRVHPNTKNKDISVKRYWKRIETLYPEKIINFDNDISSYELCQRSLFTISIGSSIAAESLILGIPHVLIGDQNWFYDFPGYIKVSEKNCIDFISDKLKNPPFFNKYEITEDHKKFAASTQLFLKLIGDKIKLTFLGKYPTPDNFKIEMDY